jgi:hypothetical protein
MLLAGVALVGNIDYFWHRVGSSAGTVSIPTVPAQTSDAAPATAPPTMPEAIASTSSGPTAPSLAGDTAPMSSGDSVQVATPVLSAPGAVASAQADVISEAGSASSAASPAASPAPGAVSSAPRAEPPPRVAATSGVLPDSRPIPPLSQRPEYEPARVAALPETRPIPPLSQRPEFEPERSTTAPPPAAEARRVDVPAPAATATDVARRDAAAERARPAPIAPLAPVARVAPIEPVAPPDPALPGREEGRVAAALDAYAHAFARLDARAARFVWPTVDERALARAFEGLASQNVVFDDCAIDVRGTSAHAACRGTASYVTKVGRDNVRVEPRTWRFELQRDGEAWKIASAEARRP